MKCHSRLCNDVAAWRVHWPGQSPPPEMCKACALRATVVADTMGFTLHVDALDDAPPPREGN